VVADNPGLRETQVVVLERSVDWPAEYLRFKGEDPVSLAQAVMTAVDILKSKNIPHNMYASGSKEVYLFPRKFQPVIPDESQVNIASLELIGHMLLKDKDQISTPDSFYKRRLHEESDFSVLEKAVPDISRQIRGIDARYKEKQTASEKR